MKPLLLAAASSFVVASHPAWATDFSDCANRKNSLAFTFGGDLTPVGHQGDPLRFERFISMESDGKGYGYAVEHVRQFFSDRTYNIVNLETAVLPKKCRASHSCSKYPKTGEKVFHFATPAKALGILSELNIRAVTVANNHSLDFGESGLRAMLESLKNQRTLAFGTDGMKKGNPLSITFDTYKGTTVALIGSSFLWGDIDAEKKRLEEAVRSSKISAEFTVVFYHWGTEGRLKPDNSQKILARAAVDAGADVVVGSHPHVVQKSEVLLSASGKKVPVRYSLWNFIFAGNLNPSNATIDRFCFEKNERGIHFAASESIPILTGTAHGNFRPVVFEGKSKTAWGKKSKTPPTS